MNALWLGDGADGAEEAARTVAFWGYPREISKREIEHGIWFANGRAIVWFIALSELDSLPLGGGTVFCVHGIADPGQTGQALTAEAEAFLCSVARKLGASKLYSLIPHETPGMPVAAMRRYLRRYGWSEDRYGSFKLIGGGL